MNTTRKWWRVPVIVSAVLGITPAMMMVLGTIFAMASARNERLLNLPHGELTSPFLHMMTGGLLILLFVEGAVWAITGIVAVVRKLRRRKVAPA